MVVAIEKLGGVSTLTADELQTVGEKAQEAADKLSARDGDPTSRPAFRNTRMPRRTPRARQILLGRRP